MAKKRKARVKNKANIPKSFIEYWRSNKSIRYGTYITILFFIAGIIYSDWSAEKSHSIQTTSLINNQQDISQKLNENISNISQQIETIQNSDLEKLLEKKGISMDEIKIIEEDSKFIGDTYYQEGIKNIRTQNFEAAFLNFNKSKSFNSNNSAAWNNMAASILRAKGESALPEALSYIERSLYLEPNNPFYTQNYGYVWYYLGSSLYFAGNYTGSLEAINKAINLGINKIEMWYFKGALSTGFENNSEQLKTYERIINRCTECDPAFLSTIWYNKGVILTDKNEPHAALEAYDKSLQLYHNDTESWNRWKQAFLFLGGLDDKWVDVSNGNVTDCTNDIRVTIDNPTNGIEEETPSLVYNESYVAGKCVSANVVYLKNSAKISHTYYGADPSVKIPIYRLRNSIDPNNINITIMWKYVDAQKKI